MRKTTLATLFAAGAMALAGAAQAATFDSPTQAGEASTMTHGAPNLLTTNSPYGDGGSTMIDYYTTTSPTTVLGAGPATVTTTTYTYSYPAYSYVMPAPVVVYDSYDSGWASASETSNVPQRAGEASTMTNGVPNLVTNNYGL
jgi:hypothetical protein